MIIRQETPVQDGLIVELRCPPMTKGAGRDGKKTSLGWPRECDTNLFFFPSTAGRRISSPPGPGVGFAYINFPA